MPTDKQKANLITMRQLTEREQREMARAGGRASVEAKRAKKTMREFLNDIMNAQPTEKEKKALEAKGVKLEDCTNLALYTYSLIQNAIKGNSKAIEAVNELVVDTKIKARELELRKREMEIKKLEAETEALKAMKPTDGDGGKRIEFIISDTSAKKDE